MTTSLLLALFTLQTASAAAGTPASADALFAEARSLMERGGASQAVPLLEQAAAIEASLGDERRRELARDWAALGLCLSAVGRTDEAVKRLLAATGVWRALDAREDLIAGLGQLAVVEFSHAR